jgi:dCTP deaminase
MILSGQAIHRYVNAGSITITDFDPKRLNPNSYNLRLDNKIAVYDISNGEWLDMKSPTPLREFDIPDSGFLMMPGELYLAKTMERTHTDHFVPMIEGRSSVGRLGIFIHVTAGFGDVGFNGYWTLEMSCIQPVMIYPYVEVCQIYYHELNGPRTLYNSGKYQNNDGIQGSKMFEDLQ